MGNLTKVMRDSLNTAVLPCPGLIGRKLLGITESHDGLIELLFEGGKKLVVAAIHASQQVLEQRTNAISSNEQQRGFRK
jgi:hypothetical protein